MKVPITFTDRDDEDVTLSWSAYHSWKWKQPRRINWRCVVRDALLAIVVGSLTAAGLILAMAW